MKQGGLTLMEVVMALAVIGISIAFFTTSVTSNLKHTGNFGQRTQATQVLNQLGRRIVGGDAKVLTTEDTPLKWDYGELKSTFKDFRDEGGVTNPNLYRASITNVGNLSLATANAIQYNLEVCYKSSGSESCVVATTLGPAPNIGGTPPPLPGIN